MSDIAQDCSICEICGGPIDDDLVIDDEDVEPTCRACDPEAAA